MTKKLLLTGATGFVGKGLLNALSGYHIHTLGRRAVENAATFFQASINADEDYQAALQGVDVVIHAAARAHIMHEQIADPLAEYRKINVDGTLNCRFPKAGLMGIAHLVNKVAKDHG